MYKLTITKLEPLTESEKKERSRSEYGFPDRQLEDSTKETRVLTIEIGEDELESIRKAVLETFR